MGPTICSDNEGVSRLVAETPVHQAIVQRAVKGT
jgi:hypothetical protein